MSPSAIMLSERRTADDRADLEGAAQEARRDGGRQPILAAAVRARAGRPRHPAASNDAWPRPACRNGQEPFQQPSNSHPVPGPQGAHQWRHPGEPGYEQGGTYADRGARPARPTSQPPIGALVRRRQGGCSSAAQPDLVPEAQEARRDLALPCPCSPSLDRFDARARTISAICARTRPRPPSFFGSSANATSARA